MLWLLVWSKNSLSGGWRKTWQCWPNSRALWPWKFPDDPACGSCWAHIPTQAKKSIPLQASSRGVIGRACRCSWPTSSTSPLMEGTWIQPVATEAREGESTNSRVPPFRSAVFLDWLPLLLGVPSAAGQGLCAGLHVAHRLHKDQELLLLRKFSVSSKGPHSLTHTQSPWKTHNI